MRINFLTFPRKRIIFIFIVLVLYVLFSFVYSQLGLHRTQGSSARKSFLSHCDDVTSANRSIGDILSNVSTAFSHKTKRKFSNCPVLGITKRKQALLKEGKIDCVEHQPSESGCKFAARTYAYDEVKRNCYKAPRINICRIDNWRFRCSHKECGQYYAGKITVHIFNVVTGKVEIVATCSKEDGDRKLAELVSKYAKITVKNNFKFMFVTCADKKHVVQQMINLNQLSKREYRNKPIKIPKGRPNINIVMFDSISRAHFYRSLHKTVAAFNAINADINGASEILDFELFQALHGHSAENAHGLFNGTVFPLDMKDSERETLPVGIDHFFNYFKAKGYDTLYQDDMCWEAIWGFRSDIGGARDWKSLYAKYKKTNVDDSGLMFSTCEMFKKFEADHIFNLEEENYVCYNGKQHNVYFLQYIYNHFLSYSRNGNKKTIAYSALNVAHDYGGVRIQAIDKDLSNFVKSASKLDNTLTIILADHGNTYTDFVYIDLEGKYEMFHPSLFMIIPKGVQSFLGGDKMNALRSNQKKLVTMIDLHHGFKHLADDAYTTRGIFTDIAGSRKCASVPLRFPNFCVCEGWNTAIVNDTEILGHIEFAIGTLNNIISNASPSGRCKRLLPVFFENVLQRKDGDYQISSFDIHTSSGKHSPNKGEKVSVEVKSKLSGSLPTYEMALSHWDRISKFGPYRECSDVADSKFRLCVCDRGDWKKMTNLEDFYYSRTSKPYSLFNSKDVSIQEKIEVIIKDQLALVIRTFNERKFENGKEVTPRLILVSFEVVNFGKSSYYVTVTLNDANNMKPLTSGPCEAVASPNSVIYLCSLQRKWNIWQAEFSYTVTKKLQK